MTIEALGLKGALAACNALVKFFTDLGNRETSKLLEAVEIDRRSHNAQVAQHVKVLVVEWAKMAKDAEQLRARVEEMAAERQFQRLQANLEYEAVRSTLDERKKMLAAAAAGLCDPTMSIEDKARVERALRDLDPADIHVLKALRSVVEESAADSPPGGLNTTPSGYVELCRRTRAILDRAPLSRGALLGTVVLEDNGYEGGPHYDASALGELVLRVLATYLGAANKGADEERWKTREGV